MWTRIAIVGGYLFVIVTGLILVEARNGWVIRSSSPDRDFPTFWAIVHWVFYPDSMQYIAAANLTRGTKLKDADLGFDPKLPEYLRNYLPKKTVVVGKVLLKDIAAGKPLLRADLDSDSTSGEPTPKGNGKPKSPTYE
jgi:SAF domain